MLARLLQQLGRGHSHRHPGAAETEVWHVANDGRYLVYLRYLTGPE
jgi:hypothetical protein